MAIEPTILPSELTARFIFQKTYFRASDHSVRHNAYIPNRNGETSIYRIDNLSDQEITEIGIKYVGEVIGKPLLGRSELLVSEVLDQSLKVISTPEPHKRHANIVDWPDDKAECKMLALELASKASLYLIN